MTVVPLVFEPDEIPEPDRQGTTGLRTRGPDGHGGLTQSRGNFGLQAMAESGADAKSSGPSRFPEESVSKIVTVVLAEMSFRSKEVASKRSYKVGSRVQIKATTRQNRTSLAVRQFWARFRNSRSTRKKAIVRGREPSSTFRPIEMNRMIDITNERTIDRFNVSPLDPPQNNNDNVLEWWQKFF